MVLYLHMFQETNDTDFLLARCCFCHEIGSSKALEESQRNDEKEEKIAH